MSAWRQAGLNYISYSTVAARLLRRALKADLKTDALKRDTSSVKVTPWTDGRPTGKPAQKKT